jgi:NAD(P)-dependent dehydrogenase (short-subunit alcohol dehydrogenase family)
MPKQEPSKVVFITGAASGIGAATAELAATRGYRVVIADINEAGARAVAAKLGDGALAVKLDITSPSQWERALDKTYKAFGRLDVLVNNAAIVHTGHVLDVPFEQHKRTLDINCLGPVLGMMTVMPRFKKAKQGHIVTICSMTAFLPFPDIASYAASKHALRAMHFGLAMEERKGPIDFTIVHPSSTETPMLEEEARNGVALAFAVPSWKPSDVAAIILDAIKKKKVEVCIPNKRGRAVKAIGVNPRRLQEMLDRNEPIGKANLAARSRARSKKA